MRAMEDIARVANSERLVKVCLKSQKDIKIPIVLENKITPKGVVENNSINRCEKKVIQIISPESDQSIKSIIIAKRIFSFEYGKGSIYDKPMLSATKITITINNNKARKILSILFLYFYY
jgi:hypothetical protein